MTQIIFLTTLLAVWQNPTPIYVGPGDQTIDVVISDGEGGAAVIWWDDVTEWNYMQVIDSAGNLKWDSEGVPIIANGSISTQNPDVFQDDEGNYWVALEGNEDIYVQKLSPTGQRLFSDDGVAVCTAEGEQHYPFLASSGMGIIIVWTDFSAGSDIYMQRLNSSGDYKWELGGLPLCTLSTSSHTQNIVLDKKGGAIVIWWDNRDGSSIYAQRTDSLGNFLWGEDGKRITGGTLFRNYRWAFPDREGGVIFSYLKNGPYCFQRLDSLGNLLWDTAGVIAGYNDYRELRMSKVGESGIYTASGEKDPQRVFTNYVTMDGVATCGDSGKLIWDAQSGNSAGSRIYPSLTEYGIIVWRDLYDELGWYEQQGVLAQRVDNEGNIQWPEEKVVSGPGSENPQVIVTNDKGGIVVWQAGDIFAAHLDSLGNISGIVEEPMPVVIPLQLAQISGNLVNGSARLRLSIPQGAFVNVAVYDASGRLVNTLINQNLSGGIHEITWNGVGQIGYKVSTGIYFVRVAALGRAATEKIVLIK